MNRRNSVRRVLGIRRAGRTVLLGALAGPAAVVPARGRAGRPGPRPRRRRRLPRPARPRAPRRYRRRRQSRRRQRLSPHPLRRLRRGRARRPLDEQIQDLKRQTVELNRDLFVLEEDLLFPANTQVAVFVSVDVGDFFALDSIDLKVDQQGGQQLSLHSARGSRRCCEAACSASTWGNLKAGSHELVAFFIGKGPNDRNYRAPRRACASRRGWARSIWS